MKIKSSDNFVKLENFGKLGGGRMSIRSARSPRSAESCGPFVYGIDEDRMVEHF